MVSIRKLIEKDESFEGYLLLPSLVRQRCLEVSKSTIKSCDNDNLPEYEYLRVKLSNFTVHGKKHRLVHLALHAEINLERAEPADQPDDQVPAEPAHPD
jgi:hypothetical protein